MSLVSANLGLFIFSTGTRLSLSFWALMIFACNKGICIRGLYIHFLI